MAVSLKALEKSAALFDRFRKEGAQPVETDVLQPAETLLDLYGEMIRARAFVTEDPDQGEMMLRPDFTVPVVNLHMQEGAEPARYTYQGSVFRKQGNQSERAAEHLQVGYEVFDRNDPARSDAEVFVQFQNALKGFETHAIIGDVGIFTAAVRGLNVSESRRNALLRHVWRANRFNTLLARFCTQVEMRNFEEADAPFIGLRSRQEIEKRKQDIEKEAKESPLRGEQVLALSDLINLKAPAIEAVIALRKIEKAMPNIGEAVTQVEARMTALAESGIDLSRVTYEGSYGRTSLEYYDGFVFGIYARQHPELPPLASGGRYDALTKVLGRGRSIPAVGGVIRPELLVKLETSI